MKRDPEVIRKLLIFFEEKKDDKLVAAKSINQDSLNTAMRPHPLSAVAPITA